MRPRLPSKSEIAPTGCDLDELAAAEHFLGLTREQVLRDLSTGAMGGYIHTADLTWMGDVAFYYYLPAFLDYLSSEASRGDCETADGLISALHNRLCNRRHPHPPLPEALSRHLVACLQQITAHPGRWMLEHELDRSTLREAQSLLNLLRA